MRALLRRVAAGFIDHGCVTYGASLAFYALFVLVPVPIFVISGAGALIGDAVARTELLALVRRLAGPQMAATLSMALDSASEAGSWRGAELFAVASSLFGGTAFFVELQEVLNKIWGVHGSRPFGWLTLVRTRLSSFVMVALSGAVLLALTLLYTVAGALGERLAPFLPMPVITLRTAGLVIALVVITLVFAVVFRFVPDVDLTFAMVWRGALATSFLFVLGKWLIGLYLEQVPLATAYGAAGSLVLTLIWVYYSALAFLIGAELTRALSARRPAGSPPAPESAAPVEQGEEGKERE